MVHLNLYFQMVDRSRAWLNRTTPTEYTIEPRSVLESSTTQLRASIIGTEIRWISIKRGTMRDRCKRVAPARAKWSTNRARRTNYELVEISDSKRIAVGVLNTTCTGLNALNVQRSLWCICAMLETVQYFANDSSSSIKWHSDEIASIPWAPCFSLRERASCPKLSRCCANLSSKHRSTT